MKNPLAKLSIIIVLTIALSQLVYFIFIKGLRKYNVHKNDRMTELFLNHTYYDVLFIGSSKTHTGVNPSIIDSITHLNTYNAGVEGGNILEFKMTLDGYLEKHKAPKLLVLHLDYYAFNTTRKFFNHTQYFPLIGKNKTIDSTLNAFGYNTLMIKYLPFMEFSEFDDYTRSNCLKGLMGKTEMNNEFQYKGYLSNTNDTISPGEGFSDTSKAIISEGSLAMFNSIIDTCSKRNIKLIFIAPPIFKSPFQNDNKAIATIVAASNKNNIPFLRHDCLGLCKRNTWFTNVSHLNTSGAREYSIIMGEELKRILSIN